MTSILEGGRPLLVFALGRGKFAKRQFELARYNQIAEELQRFPADISLKYQQRALKKAAKPGFDALRREVGQLGQVTGNLLASITQQNRKYTNSNAKVPVGVVVIGFRRPTNAPSQKMAEAAFEGGGIQKGPNRAYHSHLLEFGTRSKTPGIKTSKRVNRKRVILGGRIRTQADRVAEFSGASRRIMSSGFKQGGDKKGKRRSFSGRGQYPIDFIATGTVRGTPAKRPLAKAFASSEPQMKSLLDVELRKALQSAAREYRKRFGDLSP